MIRLKHFRRTFPKDSIKRRGVIIVLTAICLVMLLGFVALTVDIGFLLQTKTQLQATADGSILSGALELPDGWGPGKVSTATQVQTATGTVTQTVAATYKVGEQSSAYIDTTRDLRFGQRTQNAQGAWVETWGTSPYNMVEVTVRRDQPLANGIVTRGDQKIPLLFAPVLGSNYASVTATATAVLVPGNGFYIPPSSGLTCPLLPIALDETTWNNLINNGIGSDNYRYNATTKTVSSGADGIKEVSLYPDGTNTTAGNRGTVDIGSSNNSTADLSRQIRNGPNAADLAYFGGKVQIPASGLLALNGDTGLSAGIKDDLAAIIGQPRAIPIFRSVSGPGNNATYQICKFVGIRILFVRLTGSPSGKTVVIQPAPVFDGTITSSPGVLQPDSIMASLRLVH